MSIDLFCRAIACQAIRLVDKRIEVGAGDKLLPLCQMEELDVFVRGYPSIFLPSLSSPPLSYTPLSAPTFTPVHMYSPPLSVLSLGAKL
jgi:hypothetical protein